MAENRPTMNREDFSSPHIVIRYCEFRQYIFGDMTFSDLVKNKEVKVKKGQLKKTCNLVVSFVLCV